VKNPVCLLFGVCLGLGCGPGPSEELRSDIPLLEPPGPGEGVQYRMTSRVEPGIESYGCRLFQVPREGLVIRAEDVRFTLGGHHVLLYRTPYTSIPSVDERGERVDATRVHDCSQGATARWKVDAVLGGSESFGGAGMMDELPEGVGVVLEPAAVLVMSTHYLNATSRPLEVDARVNLYTMPREALKVEAGLFYLDNPMIRVPPLGHATARLRCPVPSNLSFVGLQSHMHARGTSFSASIATQQRRPEWIYSTASWQEPPVVEFDPALPLRAGSTLEIRCDYENHEARAVSHGLSSRDEMCQLIGPYFPKDERFERCEDGGGRSAMTFVGEGQVGGLGTLDCLRAAPPLADDGGYGYNDCVLRSCPGIASEVSALARCHSSGRTSCEDEEKALEAAVCP